MTLAACILMHARAVTSAFRPSCSPDVALSVRFAPCVMSVSITAHSPHAAARINALSPKPLTASTSAPLESSTAALGALPAIAANMRAFVPS
eukprot:7022872-Prymnesium_polylepis.1